MNRSKLVGMQFYHAKCVLDSPLSIGSGYNDITDHDVMLNFEEKPFIPGTSLAGVFRAYVQEVFGENAASSLFGSIEINRSNTVIRQVGKQSPVVLSDGEFIGERLHISIRDGVRLDEFKTAEDTAKFDYQVINPGAMFQFYIEVEIRENNQSFDTKKNSPQSFSESAKNVLSSIFGAINEGIIRLGLKANRGFGRFRITHLTWKEYNGENIKKLPDFDWDSTEMNPLTNVESEENPYQKMTIPLILKSPLIIRNYSSDSNADYSMLIVKKPVRSDGSGTLEEKTESIPVIPGTSWVGLFRHAFCKMLKELGDTDAVQHTTDVFGSVTKTGSDLSQVIFEESEIRKNGVPVSLYPLTRCAIDRVTGGAADGSLYTELVCPEGETKLIIRVRKNQPDWVIGIFLYILDDLNYGYLALGGETSCGRGLFQLKGDMLLPAANVAKFKTAVAMWMNKTGDDKIGE